MTDVKMVGDPEGIKLWSLMSSSSDEGEQEYFKRINAAASKYGSVWFTDVVAERKTSSSQAIFSLKWQGKKNQWEVATFFIPQGGTKKIGSRDEEWDLVNPDDVVSIG